VSPALLPLFVVAPLTAAALLAIVRRPWLGRLLLIAVPLASAAAAINLLVVHQRVPVLAHHVGGFVPGVAIPFVSDALSALMLAVTGVTTAVCGWFLIQTGEDRYRFVPALVLMLAAGVNGALLTGDLFNLFVFIEVMLLPSYALIAVTGAWNRLGIGRMFIVVNLLTSTILLIGVGFVYAVAGTVNLAELVGAARGDNRLGLAAGLVLLALAVKGSVVPVHGWLPAAYPGTSAGIMALFSGLHTKVGLYAIYRVYTTVYDGQPAPWQGVLAVVVVVTILVGAVGTFGVVRLRRALAYQMVTGVGHILLGVVVLTGAAVAAGIFYLVHHVITMAGLVLLSGAIEHTYGTSRYDRLSGLLRRDRLTTVAYAFGLLSLVGLPPTSGLWAKVFLVLGVAEGAHAWVWLGAIVLAAIASLMALQRLWDHVFWGPPMETYRPDDARTGRGEPVPLPDQVRIPLRLALPGVMLMAISAALFLGAGALLPVVQQVAERLLDPEVYRQVVLG
jgi:multicomponent Na+:H+ antiporter subunit D